MLVLSLLPLRWIGFCHGIIGENRGTVLFWILLCFLIFLEGLLCFHLFWLLHLDSFGNGTDWGHNLFYSFFFYAGRSVYLVCGGQRAGYSDLRVPITIAWDWGWWFWLSNLKIGVAANSFWEGLIFLLKDCCFVDLYWVDDPFFRLVVLLMAVISDFFAAVVGWGSHWAGCMTICRSWRPFDLFYRFMKVLRRFPFVFSFGLSSGINSFWMEMRNCSVTRFWNFAKLYGVIHP